MPVGIIAEYNPFHNGHKYQLEEAKRRFPGEPIIIIMSGKYVQRGEIAVAPFEDRKAMALKYGASKVIELPFEYATQAAHIFAEGAVKLAAKEGVTKLFFGSESNDPKRLMLIARTIKANEAKYNENVKKYLKMGYSFPKASGESLGRLIGTPIQMPNDILGLEYCKAIVYNDLDIEVYTLARTVNFHSEVPNQQFASASYIREQLKLGKNVSMYTPMHIKIPFDKIEDHYQEFQKIVKESPASELKKVILMSEGMENLFKKHIDAPNYDAFVEATNSKRYTSSRIKRVILYVLLNIKK